MIFQFTYTINGQLQTLTKIYDSRIDAINSFWLIPTIGEAKARGNRVVLINIKDISDPK